MYDIIKENYPNLPIFLLGHSMGSLIALLFVKKHEALLKGLILSGTGLSVAKISRVLKLIIKIVSKIAPKLKIKQTLDPDKLSHDPEVIKAYIEDPFVHYKFITARLGYELLKTFKDASTFIVNFKLPLLIQCGSEDQLVKGTEAELKNAFKMNDQEIHFYEGLYHEVYNETEKERKKVLKDLSSWLEKYV
jgi:alpha-beta hydrolase superfamily lysophospholipase